jgi:hypothetical protein
MRGSSLSPHSPPVILSIGVGVYPLVQCEGEAPRTPLDLQIFRTTAVAKRGCRSGEGGKERLGPSGEGGKKQLDLRSTALPKAAH